MRNIILLSIGLIFCSIPLFGQEPVDKVMYRFTYKTDFVNDTTLRDSLGNYQYAHDEMALDVGTKVSKFYSMLRVIQNPAHRLAASFFFIRWQEMLSCMPANG